MTLIQSKKFEQLLLGKMAAFSCFAVNSFNICPSLSAKYCSESFTVKKTEAEKLLVNRGRGKVSYTWTCTKDSSFCSTKVYLNGNYRAAVQPLKIHLDSVFCCSDPWSPTHTAFPSTFCGRQECIYLWRCVVGSLLKTKTVERISQRNIIRKKCDYSPLPNAFPKLTGKGSKQKCT